MQEAQRQRIDRRARIAIGLGTATMLVFLVVGCFLGYMTEGQSAGFGSSQYQIFRVAGYAGFAISLLGTIVIFYGIYMLARSRKHFRGHHHQHHPS